MMTVRVGQELLTLPEPINEILLVDSPYNRTYIKIMNLFGGKEGYEKLPVLKLGQKTIDRVMPDDPILESMKASVMRGLDCKEKHFVIVKNYNTDKKISSYIFFYGEPNLDQWYKFFGSFEHQQKRIRISVFPIEDMDFSHFPAWIKAAQGT